MSEVSEECKREDIDYDDKGKSLNVNYTPLELVVIDTLNQKIPMTSQQLKEELDILKNELHQKGVNQHSIKFIIESAIHKWYCYCMNDVKTDSEKKK